MREILFRAKRKDNGEWVEGGLCIINKSPFICYEMVKRLPKLTEVEENTVGQYTGLTDKNDTKIFEGDIVKFSYNENDKEPKFYSVEWKKDRACFGYAETADKMIEIDCFHCEVIGNIYDNPELLGGEK